MISFLIVIGVENHQSYGAGTLFSYVIELVLAMVIAIAVARFPATPRPERKFLRLLHRFFRQAEFMISAPPFDGAHQGKTGLRWRAVLYPHNLLDVVKEISACSKQIDYRLLPGTTPEHVQSVVSSLYSLAFRIEDLVAAREMPQAEVVQKRLLTDVEEWTEALERRFRRWADAEQAIASLGERLAAHLARMEARIDDMLSPVGTGSLGHQEWTNLYRLLGSYRGLSEAIVDHAERINTIDWAVWKESRF